jgi:DNA polymerase V
MKFVDCLDVEMLPDINWGDWYYPTIWEKYLAPLFIARVSAGFPSPADDYLDNRIDLNKQLIAHPSATFYVRVKGSSMVDAGINDGDMLIVDRAIEPRNNDIVVSILNWEFTVKRLRKETDGLYLMPENSTYQPVKVLDGADFRVWGVVSYIIHKAR